MPGPIYVHCHHGKHRGPAAAAVICIANDGWSSETAEAWLVAAGTATNYAGLYEVVRQFRKPTAAQLAAIPSKFPEIAKVSGLVDAMVDIDKRWEHLKAVRAAAYHVPREHPDLKPANEALILWEQYREAQRLPDVARHGPEFIQRLATAEKEAKKAERLLRLFAAQPNTEVREPLDRIFGVMGKTCASCHKAYRDVSDSSPRCLQE